jgi:hypothetical protein
MDAEGVGYLADRPSFLEEPNGKVSLFVVHLPGASEANTTFLSFGATGSGALPDQVALELGYSGEDGHDHFASVGGSVGPRLGDRLKTGPRAADGLDDLQEIAG